LLTLAVLLAGCGAAGPAPTERTVLKEAGQGVKVTSAFDVPSSWTFAWTYDCAGNAPHAAGFAAFVLQPNGSPIPDSSPYPPFHSGLDTATKDDGVMTMHSGGAGLRVSVFSGPGCIWAVVADAPP
jgi:hypothetical protein